MTDPSRYPNTLDDTDINPGQESSPKTPPWVKLFGIIILLLILAFVIMKLVDVGGDHGPGRHSSSDSTSQQAIRNWVINVGEDTSFYPEALDSGRTLVLRVPTMSRAAQNSATMDGAKHQVNAYGRIDSFTSGVAGMVQA